MWCPYSKTLAEQNVEQTIFLCLRFWKYLSSRSHVRDKLLRRSEDLHLYSLSSTVEQDDDVYMNFVQSLSKRRYHKHD